MNEIQESLIQAMDLLSNHSVVAASSVLLLDAKITKVEDSNVGLYTISSANRSFVAQAVNMNYDYQEGDRVYVLVSVRDNIIGSNRIILGKKLQ